MLDHLFPGYHILTESERKSLWETAIFVPDASVLLDLYRYSESTRAGLLDTLSNLSDRLWFPFQVAEEFARNRYIVIANQQSTFDEVKKQLQKVPGEARESLKKALELRPEHSVVVIDDLVQIYKKATDDCIKILDAQKDRVPSYTTRDPIYDAVCALMTDETIGPRFAPSELADAFAEGQDRFEQNQPPGYMDKGKGPNKYGDWYLWKQILNKLSKEPTDVIFITSDAKDDWRWKVGGKAVGARGELVHELREVAPGKRLHVYMSNEFLDDANRFGIGTIQPAVISEVKEVNEDRVRGRLRADDLRTLARTRETFQRYLVGNGGILDAANSAEKMQRFIDEVWRNIQMKPDPNRSVDDDEDENDDPTGTVKPSA